MARFSEHFIQQVAQATDIVELVGQYVTLTRRGREFVGLCPFHDDHKPSMYVAPAKQIFKCFSCGAGGGVYQFLILYDKISFPEAVRALAERARIPLPADAAEPDVPGGLSKAELAEVIAFAARFFRGALRAGAGKAALEYARGRGLSEASIERFSLGYAPAQWDALARAARGKGFSEQQLVAAGLAVARETGGCYDRFRNRLIFPILDLTGRVIAFGGRALDPEDRAKYLNSAESILFDKSGQLYALNWAREGIARSGQAVVAEGYLDALIPLQEGVDNIVATLGTSLTDRHVRLLSRYAKEAVLVFDADTAGAAAADRALELFLAQRVHVRVATIPAGKDPCDYTLAEGAEALGQLLAAAPDAIQYAWGRRQEQLAAAGGNLADRQRVIEEFLRLIVSSSTFGAIDEVRRGQLAQHIGHMLNVSPTDLQQQMRRLARRLRQAGKQGGTYVSDTWRPERTTELAERHLLEVLLNDPELFDLAAERIDWHDFVNPELREIAQCVWALGQDGRLSLEEVLAAEAMGVCGPLLTDLMTEGERRGNQEGNLHAAVSSLLYFREKRQAAPPSGSGYTDEALQRVMRASRPADQRRSPKIT